MHELIKKATSSLAATIPTAWLIAYARKTNRIHLSAEELSYIATVVKRKAPCRFLVFGFGNDSYFWMKLNHAGVTIFLEDDPGWFDQVTHAYPELHGCLVRYDTKRTEWGDLLEQPAKLEMMLPGAVVTERFSCILVDGPHGWRDDDPGRMKSIFEASRLIDKNGDIFVHDTDREIEKAYCNRYLGQGVLKREFSRLRHYHFE